MEVVEPKWRRTAQGKGRCEAGEMQQGKKMCNKVYKVMSSSNSWRTRLGIGKVALPWEPT